MKHRARLFSIIVVVITAVPLGFAGSQEFKPSKQIEAVVHTGPGGGSDLLARAIAELLQKEKLITQRMQVVNKPGGGPAVAMSYLVEKKGETHTIGFFTGVCRGDGHRKGFDSDCPSSFGAGGHRGQGGFALQKHERLHRRGQEKSQTTCPVRRHDNFAG